MSIQMLLKLTCTCSLICLLVLDGITQECGPCKKRPSLALFDFDVQVAGPNTKDTTQNLWPEWKALFQLAGSVGTNLFASDSRCIKFTQPPSFDSGDTMLVSVGGETFTNLPDNPHISSNLSVYGDYFLSGRVYKSAGNIVLEVEVKSGCSRKTVAKAQANFPFENIVGNVSTYAKQVSAQLSPLIDKINLFEKTERSANPQLSIDYFTSEPITVTPAKKILKPGESTTVQLLLRDCDGVPLGNREIIFKESSFEGFALPATKGGTISPAVVKTDAQGKATVKFTLNAGAREAVINAHSIGRDVKGCGSAFTGSAVINIKAVYSGYVKYRVSNNSNCSQKGASGCQEATHVSHMSHGVDYTASFYIAGEKSSSLHASFDTKEKANDGTAIPDALEAGSYDYSKNENTTHTIICESANKGETAVQRIHQEIRGKLAHSGLAVSADESNSHVRLSLEFETSTKTVYYLTTLGSSTTTTEEKTNWDVQFDSMIDKDLQFKKTTSGGRTQYTFELTRTINQSCVANSTETLKVVVWEE